MENLTLEGDYGNPTVNFNAESGELLIEGRSIPEHANLFYDPLINWVKEYVSSKPESTTLTMRVDYVNSSSQKFLLELFEKLEPLHSEGKAVVIKWHYEDDDEEMKDSGEEFEESTDVPFEFVAVEEF